MCNSASTSFLLLLLTFIGSNIGLLFIVNRKLLFTVFSNTFMVNIHKYFTSVSGLLTHVGVLDYLGTSYHTLSSVIPSASALNSYSSL